MPGTPWRARLAAFGATTVILVAACGGSATPTPAPATAAPTEAPHRGAVRGDGLPGDAVEAPCGVAALHRQRQVDQGRRREDRRVHPLRPRRRLPLEGRLQPVRDQRHGLPRERRAADGYDRPQRRTAPAPTSSRNGSRATTSPSRPTRRYWGAKAPKTPTVVFRWSTEAAQRLVELQSGNADGIDNPGPTDFETIAARPEPQALPARRPQRLLRRHEQHLPAVRQRQGPPGDRHGARPAADRRQLHAARLAGRDPLHAVLDPERLRRRRVVRLRRVGRQGAPRRGRLPRRLQDHDPPPRRRPRLPRPAGHRGPGHPGPAQGRPEHRRHDRRPGVRHLHRQRRRRQARRHPPPRAGAPTTRTSPTSSTTTSAPARAQQFGEQVPRHRGSPPGRRAGRLRRDPRAVVRRRQQRDQAQRPDGPDLPRGLRHGLQAPTSRAPTARRSRARCSP